MEETEETAKTLGPRDWAAGLPPDLLGSVLDRLTSVEHLRFAAVCTPWRSAVNEVRRRPAPESPWILLSRPPDITGAEEEEEDEEDTHDYFHFMRPFDDGKTHAIRRALPPDFHWKRFVGVSADGWVILLNKSRGLRALNPITGALLRLPRVATIPKGFPKQCAKIVMSSPLPGGPGSVVFAAFLRNNRKRSSVALARAGDKKWSLLDTGALGKVCDLTYHAGEFYILTEIETGDRRDVAICMAVVGGDGLTLSSPPEVVMIRPTHSSEFGHRLAGSTLGDLWLVSFSDTFHPHVRCSRLDLLPDGHGGRFFRSVELEDLDDRALLLADKCSMVVSTLQVSGLRKNCIYSVDYGYLQTFNMDDGSTQTQYFDRKMEAASWFMPGVL